MNEPRCAWCRWAIALEDGPWSECCGGLLHWPECADMHRAILHQGLWELIADRTIERRA